MRTLPYGAFGGAPFGATKRVKGVVMGGEPHAGPATGAFGGVPYGATKRMSGVPKWAGIRMRTLPVERSMELPMGPRSV
eukprot:2763953-Pyramimonas_sp.AAC.1